MPKPTMEEQQEIARLRESSPARELLESRTVERKHQVPSKGLASEGPFAFRVKVRGMKKKTPQNRGKTGKSRGGIPPVEHRFKPGQSGNPGGRRTGRLWGLSLPGHGGKPRHPDKTPTLTLKESL